MSLLEALTLANNIVLSSICRVPGGGEVLREEYAYSYKTL